MGIRDIQQNLKQQIATREENREVVPALLVEINGSVTPPTRQNYVYFQELGMADNAISVALNMVVKPVAGLPVLVGRNPKNKFQREIIGLYVGGLPEDQPDNIGSFNLPNHADTHEYPSEDNIGLDPVRIFQPAIWPLKTVTNGDLTVDVQPFVYHSDGVRYEYTGETIDLTSYVPSTVNYHKFVLLTLEIETNKILVVDGTAISQSLPFNPVYVNIPRKTYPSSYIYLYEGQTEISQIDDIADSRQLFEGFDTSEPYQTNREGEILIAIDGKFQQGLFLVDSFGEIIVDSFGIPVVV